MHETLFQNVIKILTIIYQNKTKIPGKIGSFLFSWNCLMVSDKLGLSIRMRTFNNSKHCNAVCLKFGDLFVTFLAMLELQTKFSFCSRISAILLLYCRKLLVFVIVVIIYHILTTRKYFTKKRHT